MEHPRPPGPEFYDAASGRTMLYCDQAFQSWKGWLFYKHPDGQWVALRKATDEDIVRLIERVMTPEERAASFEVPFRLNKFPHLPDVLDRADFNERFAAAIRAAEQAARAEALEEAAKVLDESVAKLTTDLPSWREYLGEAAVDDKLAEIGRLERLAAAIRKLKEPRHDDQR